MKDLEINISMKDILSRDNIAERLNDEERLKIANLVNDTYTDDLETCKERFDMNDKIMSLAMQDVRIRENKPSGCIPMIYAAAQRYNADAYPALVRDGNIIKTRILGNDDAVYAVDDEGNEVINPETQQREEVLPAGTKMEKGDRVSEFENYIISNHIDDWQKNEDRLLFSQAILGDMFKKTYYDSFKKKIVSELIFPNDLVVNDNATNMKDFPVTQVMSMTQNDVMQRIRSGYFVEHELNEIQDTSVEDGKEEEKTEEYDSMIEVLEQHRLLDLDGDGYKEPYIVITANDKLLRISKRFYEDDVLYNDSDEIINIESFEMFTQREFIPNPKGTFYNIGFGHILYKINKTVNTTNNQLIEAGINANMTRGFISSDLRIRGGDMALKQQEWINVRASGVSIRDNIVPLVSKEPSIVLFNLMTFLIETGQKLSGITDVLGGSIPANMQPTTALASIEQGLKEFKAIYKRQHRGLTEEAKKIHKIIYLNPERFEKEYLEVLDDNDADFSKDFNNETLDIQLTADTEVVTNIERVAKSNFLMQFIGNRDINQYELLKRILSPMKIENVDDIVIKPQPSQPDPMAEMMKQQQQIELAKTQVQIQDSNRQVAEAAAKARSMDAANLKAVADAEKSEAQVEKTRAETMSILSTIPANKAKLEKEADNLYEPKTKESNGNDEGRPETMER